MSETTLREAIRKNDGVLPEHLKDVYLEFRPELHNNFLSPISKATHVKVKRGTYGIDTSYFVRKDGQFVIIKHLPGLPLYASTFRCTIVKMRKYKYRELP